MKLIERIARPAPSEERYSLAQLAADLSFSFGGHRYPLGMSAPQGPPGVPSESAPGDFEGMVRQVYYRSGIISACIAARRGLLSEARFKFRNFSDRRVFGSEELLPLERPWPNGTSGDILSWFEIDASLNGNSYLARMPNGELHRLRPDWVHIALGSNMADEYEVADAPDATVAGYVYWPGGSAGKYKPRFFAPDLVAHYAPEPDPLGKFRGVSWVSQVLTQVDVHRQFGEYKAGFLERGATPSFAIKYPETVASGANGTDEMKRIIEMFREQHEGVDKSWKALHLFGGADPVSIGTNFRDLDLKSVQGSLETEIASRARVPAAVLGISEGLAGSALNAGNFGQARRQFGEQYAYPSLRQACEALASLVRVPAGAELWYDLTDVAFLREDARDAADVIATQAQAIRTLVDGGMNADAAVTAVTGGDLSLLAGQHSGLVPVQLQPPGAGTMDGPSAPASDNGAGN